MKTYIFPFLFFCTVALCQNTGENKPFPYEIDLYGNELFPNPLYGKIKSVHTAYFSVTDNENSNLKKELYEENYTYGFDERGNNTLFVQYNEKGNIKFQDEKRYNEQDSITYIKHIGISNDKTYITETFFSYNRKGFLTEKEIKESNSENTLHAYYKEVYEYNDNEKLAKYSTYRNDTLREYTDYLYNDKQQLIKAITYYPYNHYLLSKKSPSAKEKEYIYLLSDEETFISYEYDEKDRLILSKKNIGGKEYTISKNIYKDNLLVESYDNNQKRESTHIFYRYKNKKLAEKENFMNVDRYCYISKERNKEVYDEKGRLKKYYRYLDDKIWEIYTYFYDEKDRIIKTEHFNNKNKKEYYRNYYNKEGKIIKTIYNNPNKGDKDLYTYDKNNNLIIFVSYNDHKEIKKTLYTYDNYNNCIKIEEYNDENIKYIYERTFTYYKRV